MKNFQRRNWKGTKNVKVQRNKYWNSCNSYNYLSKYFTASLLEALIIQIAESALHEISHFTQDNCFAK